jgi:MFS family permease
VSGTGFAAAVPALRYRDFRLFWAAALVSNTGSWMQNAAVPYAIFRLTGANLDVGVTGFWLYFPMVLMGGLGGTLADRFQRKRLLVATQAIQAAFSVALWAVVVLGHASVASISALSFGAGLAGGLNIPIWQSFVSQLVPRDTLANAVVLNSTQFNAARALGPLLFGGVVATFDVEVAFLLNAASFVAVLAVLPFIGAPQPPRPDGPRPSPWADLVAGARYVWHTPGILACCVAIVAIAGIGNPLFSFLPASYGQEIFGVRGWALGLLSGAGGVGALIFAPLILTRGATMARSHLLVVAMVTYGAAVAVVGMAPVLWVALVGGLLFGGSYLAIASAINTTIQLLAREDMRGKSIAVYIMCLTGSLPIGLAIWGAVADVIGIRVTTVAAGLLLVAVTGLLHLTGRFAAMGQADVQLAGP